MATEHEIGGVCFCKKKGCSKLFDIAVVYDNPQKDEHGNIILPCGHRLHMMYSGALILKLNQRVVDGVEEARFYVDPADEFWPELNPS